MAEAANGAARSVSSSENEGAHVNDAFCSECYGIGRAKIETREVPGFRRIIVRAFECEDCGFKSDEVQLAGQHDTQGVRLALAVPQGDAATLQRQVLKSDTATISIPELEFEIGAGSYVPFAGNLSTVAGVLMAACKDLNTSQAQRRAADAEVAGKIDDFILELEGYAEGQHAFTFVVEDPAGNSFISGPDGGSANTEASDPQLKVERFARTAAQESRMGLAMPDEFLPFDGPEAPASAAAAGRLVLRVEGQQEVASFLDTYSADHQQQQEQEQHGDEQGEQQQAEPPTAPAGVQLPGACTACGAVAGPGGLGTTLHRPVPGFIRSCVIIGAACAACSTTSAEVRSTGGVSPRGTVTRLRVETPADLDRALLQSSSASIALPELELALSSGGELGLVTTPGKLILGLASQMASQRDLTPEWADFAASVRSFAALERPWTLELTDPLDCSYVAPPACSDGAEDARLTVESYERTSDEIHHYGLAAGGSAAPIA